MMEYVLVLLKNEFNSQTTYEFLKILTDVCILDHSTPSIFLPSFQGSEVEIIVL